MKPIIYLLGIWQQFTHEAEYFIYLFIFNLTARCLSAQKERLWAQNPFLWVCLESVWYQGRVSSSSEKAHRLMSFHGLAVAKGLWGSYCTFSCAATKTDCHNFKPVAHWQMSLILKNKLFPPVEGSRCKYRTDTWGTDCILGSYWQLGCAPGLFKVEVNSKSS